MDIPIPIHTCVVKVCVIKQCKNSVKIGCKRVLILYSTYQDDVVF